MAGLFFNKAADSCDYARNVICAKKAAAPASTTAATPTTSSSPSPVYGRTTTTTTTTTTTEAPVEEEEEEEVEDEEEDGGQEDPEALKELLNLIKKLGKWLGLNWPWLAVELGCLRETKPDVL